MKKRLLVVVLSVAMILSAAQTVFADRKSDLQNSVANDTNQLEETKGQIQQDQQANEAVEADIADLDNQLITLMTNIEMIKIDIENTNTELATAEEDLEEAEDDREKQYNDMGQRIRYLYENSNYMGIFTYILEAKDIGEMLNRIAYANDMYSYDREQLQKYEECVARVTSIKDELEQIKASLMDEETSLEEQQTSLDSALAEKKVISDNYEAEIAALEEQAQQLTSQINSNNAELQAIHQAELEAAARAAEEAARKAAEEEARRQAEEEAARKAEQEKEESKAAESKAEESKDNTESSQTEQPQIGNDEQAGTVQKPASTPAPTQQPAPSTSGNIGQDIANYALQFVGNPYVAGGCSLTNGADCAGFVYSVYKHFGYSMQRNPDWMSTQYGRQISTSELKPGDIVGYYGHVGIYIGNNSIVHASSPSVGITITSPITYRSIRACARIFDY